MEAVSQLRWWFIVFLLTREKFSFEAESQKLVVPLSFLFAKMASRYLFKYIKIYMFMFL